MAKTHSAKPASTSKAGGVAGRQNIDGYSGNANARYLSAQPASNTTTQGGAYDSSATHVRGPEGQPAGTINSQYMSAQPGSPQSITPGVPLRTSGRATDAFDDNNGPNSYAVSRPKNEGKL